MHATRPYSFRQPVRASRYQDDNGVGRWLFEGLEKSIGGIDVHKVSVIDDEDLFYALVWSERQHLSCLPDHLYLDFIIFG